MAAEEEVAALAVLAAAEGAAAEPELLALVVLELRAALAAILRYRGLLKVIGLAAEAQKVQAATPLETMPSMEGLEEAEEVIMTLLGKQEAALFLPLVQAAVGEQRLITAQSEVRGAVMLLAAAERQEILLFRREAMELLGTMEPVMEAEAEPVAPLVAAAPVALAALPAAEEEEEQATSNKTEELAARADAAR